MFGKSGGVTQKEQKEAQILFVEAKKHAEAGRVEQAERILRAALKRAPMAEGWRALGFIKLKKSEPLFVAYMHAIDGNKGEKYKEELCRELDAIAECFSNALEINEDDHESISGLGEIYFWHGDRVQAIAHYVAAIQIAPHVLAYKTRFVELAGKTYYQEYNALAAGAMLECLKTPEVECENTSILWFSLLEKTPAFKECFQRLPKNVCKIEHDDFILNECDCSYLLDPYFVLGLRKLVVKHPSFENLMTILRRTLLLKPDALGLNCAQRDTLLEATAHYCFFTDYIFVTTPAEDNAVAALKAKIESLTDVADAESDILCLACYEPLYWLKNAAVLSSTVKANSPLAAVAAGHIDSLLKMRETALNIPAVAPIKNEISRKVQEQYEGFPYPTWKALRECREKRMFNALHNKDVDVLVAGCGTGREALEIAKAFPQVRILAVDLSRISLAYGIHKSREFGITNVTFMHGDILELAALNRSFDYISCGGVLHHMEDPMAGWRVLTALLKPKGLMRIALYSEIARQIVVAARDAIRNAGIPSTRAGIRTFRRDVDKYLSAEYVEELSITPDYYYTPNCRDLLFHVQEHRFDIPRLKSSLDALGYEFVEFNTYDEILADYMRSYPEDRGGANLDNWKEYEEKNPSIFKGMYQFYCRPKTQ